MLQQIKHNIFISIIGFLSVMVLFTGCDSSGSETSMGTMEVRLHDAPAKYDAVNIFIERVEVNREESSEGWITISEPNQTFDLLELTNGAYEVLGEAELKAGTYHQIRLILGQDGHSVVVDGEEKNLFVPSGEQTGVKLNVNAEIGEDITYTLLLDFDASRSVVEAGHQDQVQYLLKPVIRASNQAITGNIEGTVSPAEAQPVIYAIADSDTLTSTYADTTNGYFKLVGLEEGSYTVSIDPGNTAYQSKDTTGVEVTTGETNSLGELAL